MAIGWRRLRLAREHNHGKPYCIGQHATTHGGVGKGESRRKLETRIGLPRGFWKIIGNLASAEAEAVMAKRPSEYMYLGRISMGTHGSG